MAKTVDELNKERGARLAEARLKAGFETARQASQALGLAEQTYYNWESGKRRPDDADLLWLAQRYRVRPEWLAFGIDDFAEITEGIISEVDARAGAGLGGVSDLENATDKFGITISQDAVRDTWKIPDTFLRGVLRMDARGAWIIEVDGDSGYDPSNPHAPGSVFSGDRVIVDTRDRRPSPPGHFLVFDGIGLVVKQVDVVRGSDPVRIRLTSRNPAYVPYEVSEDEARIIGRVRGRISAM